LLNADVNKMDEIIALNITALTRLTYAAAPAFVARGTGAIINIGSVVGVSPEALNGVYGASKAYVLRSAIRCSTSSPTKVSRPGGAAGATATDLWEIAGLHAEIAAVDRHVRGRHGRWQRWRARPG